MIEQTKSAGAVAVDDYIASAPAESRQMLNEMRALIRSIAPGADEAISYQMPMFKLKLPLVYYGGWKTYCSLYAISDALLDAHAAELKGYRYAKSTLRFALDKPLPVGLISMLVRGRLAEVIAEQEVRASQKKEPRRKKMVSSGTGTLKIEKQGDRAILIERVFDAPRDLVFEAHSKCEHIEHWWGPRGYTMPSCNIDFRPGGAWRIVQAGPDGAEYAFRGEFREIVRPERIVWTFEYEGMPGHISVETLTLTEEGRKTRLSAVSVFDTQEDRDGMIEAGMELGVREGYERLDELLETLEAR